MNPPAVNLSFLDVELGEYIRKTKLKVLLFLKTTSTTKRSAKRQSCIIFGGVLLERTKAWLKRCEEKISNALLAWNSPFYVEAKECGERWGLLDVIKYFDIFSGKPRVARLKNYCSKHSNKEESNSAGDINDTINYGAHCVHTSNVNMKSPWDDFLPIKEQIKDESDASNYEDEIVKTEMIYNAYPGKMESASYHYTQENKFQEDIALHMEEVGNVKPRIVLNMLRKEDIVWPMEEDEFNTSDYKDEIVNTKMKFYDSSLEKSDSTHYIPENKSQPGKALVGGKGSPFGRLKENSCIRLAKKMKRLVRANDSPMHKRFPMPNGIIQSSLMNFPSVSRNLCGLNTSGSPQCSLSCMRVHKLGISSVSCGGLKI
uniref:Uncharacterized protein n=1 Tax=Timema genevievae TaxID=629358 RepID=A0A7R9JXR3_TIMGE|nr:unnamed protein product [Timema genevievae]